MKNGFIRTSIILFLLILVLSGCDTGSLLLSQNLGRDLPVRTISKAAQLSSNVSIPVVIDEDMLAITPDLVLVEIRDSQGRIVAEKTYIDRQLSFPELEDFVPELLEEGVYSLRIELFDGDDSLGVKESWFYYSSKEISIQQITVNPHSANPGEKVLVSLSLDGSELDEPYVQFRMNGIIVFESILSNASIQFEMKAPDTAGVYDLQLDVYPWFDARINGESRSTTRQSLELLVVNQSGESESQITELPVSTGTKLAEDQFFYEDSGLSSRVSFSVDPLIAGNEGVLFSAGNGRTEIHLVGTSDLYRFNINSKRGNWSIPFNASFDDGTVNLDILEGDTHLTVLLSNKDRLLAGEIFPYAAVEDDIAEDSEILNGYDVLGAGLTSMVIGPIAGREDLVSLFKLILQKKYGDFILFAEGFEFASSVHSEISYSDEAFLENGYLVLPPGEWVELPVFALDEYLVSIELQFRNTDDLDDSVISVLQLDEQLRSSEIFSFIEARYLSSAGIVLSDSIQLSSKLEFNLKKIGPIVNLELNDNSYTFPGLENGRFRIYIKQGEAARLRLHLDSASAVNTPTEFVDKVLDSLP